MTKKKNFLFCCYSFGGVWFLYNAVRIMLSSKDIMVLQTCQNCLPTTTLAASQTNNTKSLHVFEKKEKLKKKRNIETKFINIKFVTCSVS